MDSSLYKTTTTSRGFNYRVYHQEGTDSSKPTILLLHGFPSSSYDWRHQIAYFGGRGHAILAPDLLGYGKTDKPTDVAAYAASKIAQDVYDVLEVLGIKGPIVAIGHDWGSKITSRLANIHPERFQAFAFLAVSYAAPDANTTYEQLLGFTKMLAGFELFGYWGFFSEDDAPELVKKYYDTFWNSSFGGMSAEEKKVHFAPTGGLRAYLSEDKPRPFTLPSYLTPEEHETQKTNFWNTGIGAPFCWYKTVTTNLDREDAKTIPVEAHKVTVPVFFAAAEKDVITSPAFGMASIKQYCTKPTVKSYDADHWVMWEAKDKLNEDLAAWIDAL